MARERPARVIVPGRGVFAAAPGATPALIASLLESHRRESDPSRVLKRNRGTLVTRVSSSASGFAGDWVVKESPLPWRRRLYHRLGGVSRLAGEFERVEDLAERGIDAPRPLASSARPAGRSEYLITEFITGASALRDLLWMGPRPLESGDRRRLLDRAGAWLRRLHDAGVWQRDMKAGNVLVTGWTDDRPRFFLIDIDAVRIPGRPLEEGRRARNLAQVLDLPARLDGEARAALLAGYSPDCESRLRRLDRLAARALESRRKDRERRTGARHVDEEIARP